MAFFGPPFPIGGANAGLPLVHAHLPNHSDRAICCVVCGIPLLPTVESALTRAFPRAELSWMKPVLLRPKPAYHEAMQRARYAHAYRRCDDDLLHRIEPVEFVGGGAGFRVVDDTAHGSSIFQTTKILPIDAARGGEGSADRLPVPLHTACLDVARQFCAYQAGFEINFRAPDGGAPSSIAHLWEIWMKRMLMTIFLAPGIRTGSVLDRPVCEPHDYLGALQESDLARYVSKLQANPARWARFQANPWRVRGITGLVVGRHLRRIPEGERGAYTEAARLLALVGDVLPPELRERVEESMEPFADESLTCTRAYPPEWWRNKLFEGRLLPWLWDLNFEVVRAARRAEGIDPDDERGWDWEFLARQLSQSKLFDEGCMLHGSSDELWNRYRIWTLLSKARLGHLVYASL